MHQSDKNTAVLVFIRSEKDEAQVKKFGSCLSFKGNCQVATLLNKRIKSIAKKSGLPTVVISGNQQKGENFGERFTQAIQQVFEKGYKNVIAIGNDCLSISPQLLRKAALELQRKKVVIGPTHDGGVYLLGFQKSAIASKQLAALPWQTNQLFTTLKSLFLASPHLDFHLFDKAIDADDAHSFQTVLNHLHSHFSFKNQLQNLFQSFEKKQFFIQNFQPTSILNKCLSRRGPPQLFTTF